MSPRRRMLPPPPLDLTALDLNDVATHTKAEGEGRRGRSAGARWQPQQPFGLERTVSEPPQLRVARVVSLGNAREEDDGDDWSGGFDAGEWEHSSEDDGPEEDNAAARRRARAVDDKRVALAPRWGLEGGYGSADLDVDNILDAAVSERTPDTSTTLSVSRDFGDGGALTQGAQPAAVSDRALAIADLVRAARA